jgi:hypothetical protein
VFHQHISSILLRRKLPQTNRSRAFLVEGSKVEVLRRERGVKKQFAAWRVDERLTEWFDGAVMDDVLAAAGSFEDERDLVMQTLRAALEIQVRVDCRARAVWH